MNEIERKFIVPDIDKIPNNPEEILDVVQFGIGNGEKGVGSARIRISDKACVLTIKGPMEGITRKEFEYEIPRAHAVEMMEAISKYRAPIIKQRRWFKIGDLLWEVDIFGGKNQGLVIAEVELKSEGQRVDIPDWIGEEVSDDKKYLNTTLERRPFVEWSDEEKLPHLKLVRCKNDTFKVLQNK